MRRTILALIVAALTASAILVIGVRSVGAEDFRVENKVYFGDDPEPRIEELDRFLRTIGLRLSSQTAGNHGVR